MLATILQVESLSFSLKDSDVTDRGAFYLAEILKLENCKIQELE